MIFSSVTFLFFFLPGVLSIVFLAPWRWRNFLLLLASLLFYVWGEGIYVLMLLASIIINSICGQMIDTHKDGRLSRAILISGVSLNIVMLAFFKYANFFVETVNPFLLLLHLPSLVIDPVHRPIGISFFTFQAISYLVDIYRQQVKPAKNPFNFALYLSFFPVCLAGPILRYPQFAEELRTGRSTVRDFVDGSQRFLMGLAKKVLLANPLALIADQIFALPARELSPSLVWLGVLCYTLQIYFDFSGYSDMAIGIARFFGLHIPENFNYPYSSRSIREFWRRWHISLSTWLRDYLYIPLGGSRQGTGRTFLNLLVVFFLCGLWHGASWTFICWGLYHGFFLVLERSRLEQWRKKLWIPLQHLQTMLIIMVGWVLFRSETMADALRFFSLMSGMDTLPGGHSSPAQFLDKKAQLELVTALLFSLPIMPLLRRWRDTVIVRSGRFRICVDGAVHLTQLAGLAALFYFAIISIAAGVYSPFIYLKF
ncbi:MAG: MBOAT family O-acyltransferase [Pseudomonadota bacterium]